MSTQATTLLLCRHGETDANAVGILQGQSESQLTALGRQQAALLGAALSQLPLPQLAPVVYASDLSRAADTASAIIAAQEQHALTLTTDERLRERRLGCFQGLTISEIHKRFPRTWQAFTSDQPQPSGARKEVGADANGGYELVAELRARVGAALHDISLIHEGQTILCVAHGGSIAAAITSLTDTQCPPHIGNCSITRLTRVSAGAPWVLESANETTHVVDAGAVGAKDDRNVDVAPRSR